MTNPQRTDNPIPKAPGEPLPGGPIDGTPEPLQNGVWQWTASNAEDDEVARDDTIIDWDEPDDGQHGWYIVTHNADGDPLVRTGPYADGGGREPGYPGPPAQIRTCALAHTAPTLGG